MAALIKTRTGVDPELVVGGRGEFTVWVGDEQVAQKDQNGFPEDEQVLAAIQTNLIRASRRA